MNKENEYWIPVEWHCPNCGQKMVAYKTADEVVKAKCSRCQMVIVRRKMSRRHTRLDLYPIQNESKESKTEP